MKSQLDQILTSYFKEDYVNFQSLEEIPCFKQSFCQFLQQLRHTYDDDLEESFKRWCIQLSKGSAFPEARRLAVYVLWFHCELKQYHIAKLLNKSSRTIRRDMRMIESQMNTWH